MKFARIEMLFLMWTAPVFLLAFVYGMKKRRKILSAFASEKGQKAILPDVRTDLRWIKAALILCTMLFIAVALAGPQYGYRWQEIEQKGVDIIVALDCSRSMLATDVQPTRLDRAKRKVYDLLTIMKGDRVGLVAFSGTAFLQCPLTLDYEAFHLFLNALTPDYLPVGGTDIAGAVKSSLSGFESKSNTEKAIILITDGENTGSDDPIKAAEEAKTSGVKIFCIGVGSEQGVPVPEPGGFKKDKIGKIVMTKLDEDMLKKMAVLTGGTYVRSVAGDMDLDVIYTKEIRGKMEGSTLASGRKQIWEDRYQWVLALAILALSIELFVPSRKKSTIVILLLMLMVSNPPVYAGNMKDGLTAYEKGDYEKALKYFIDEQLDHPDNPQILYNIGNAYYKKGDYNSAANNFKEALKSEDNSLKEKAFYNLGNTNFRQKKYEESVKNYDEALKIDPNDAQAKENVEFVKQVIAKQKEEQEKKQQEQNKDGKDEKDSDKKESKDSKGDSEKEKKEDAADQKSDEQKSGEQKSGESKEDDSKKDSTQYGKEMEDKNQDSEQGKAGQESDKKPDEQKDGVAKAAPSEASGDSEKGKQAERVLNRLIDQPGKAMIPSYGQKRIEKDW